MRRSPAAFRYLAGLIIAVSMTGCCCVYPPGPMFAGPYVVQRPMPTWRHTATDWNSAFPPRSRQVMIPACGTRYPAVSHARCGCSGVPVTSDPGAVPIWSGPTTPVTVHDPSEPHTPIYDPPQPLPGPQAPVSLVDAGRHLFFDATLSEPDGQSCATCHAPQSGFADPDHSLPVSRGVLKQRTGSRNAPTAAYASFSPPLHYDESDEAWVGGLFWDGRASSLKEQAQGPPLNPVEMNNESAETVVRDARTSARLSGLAGYFGPGRTAASAEVSQTDVHHDFERIAEAIAAYESSAEVNAFSSRYDRHLRGEVKLTPAELRGLELFNGRANCAACHPSTVIGDEPGPLFTDFTYDNVGIPRNARNPWLSQPPEVNPEGGHFVDHGLMVTVAKIAPERAAAADGQFKVPTLRNVALTAPYGHNGYFGTLKEIIHFYNTRDVAGAGWEPAEIPATVNHDELGNLGLSEQDEEDLVAFLQTLTDEPPDVRGGLIH